MRLIRRGVAPQDLDANSLGLQRRQRLLDRREDRQRGIAGLTSPLVGRQRELSTLAQALIDLRTLRSGGHPWRPAELISLLAAHEFRAARHQPRSWPAPVELYTAERP